MVRFDSMDTPTMIAVSGWSAQRGERDKVLACLLDVAPEKLQNLHSQVLVYSHGKVFQQGPETYWISPENGVDFFRQAQEKLDGLAAVTEITDAYRWWRLEGESARATLMRATKLDFGEINFPAGHVVHTRVWSVQATIHCVKNGSDGCFEIALPATYAQSALTLFTRAIQQMKA